MPEKVGIDCDVLKVAIVKAFNRSGQIGSADESTINLIAQDITEHFSNESFEDITEAMKKGALGFYGTTYKICSQVIFTWIKKYLKEKNYDPYKTTFASPII